jgi:CHAT domain-containing protein/tetratricopeptide (TPR) repeat protein
MQRVLVGLVAAFLLAASALAPAWSQATGGDFSTLFARWQQEQDIEERIYLGQTLLAEAPVLTPWPLAAERALVIAELQFGTASAYINRPTGVRADNIETAITLFEAALPAWTFERDPQNWATLQNNVGIAYWARIRGERADNQDRAIAHFESALRVFTRESAPEQWGRLQNNLAVVHQSRIRGTPAENLEASITHTEAALSIFTREAAPLLWAMAKNNLGSSYRNRIAGVRAENYEKAIAHISDALQVFTSKTVPREWASAHYNLASIYLARINGESAENQEQAIAHLDAALTVFTRSGFPMEWARAQNSLGNAYSDRIRGLPGVNREIAIAAYEAALSVFTRDAYPHEHLRTGRALGHVLLQARDWSEASAVHQSAREAFLLLFGQGFDETEARSLIADAGPLFAEAALGALERGAVEAAVALSDESRARLLAVSLRLQMLELSSESRARLDSLRAAIRKSQDAVETATGPDRAVAIDQLGSLRRELLQFVTASGASDDRSAVAFAEARRIASAGGAVAIPIVTALGGRLIVLSGTEDIKATVIDVPELTPARLSTLLAGPDGTTGGGWIGAYFANYFEGEEKQKRWPQWMAAIVELGPELWRLFGGELDAALKAQGLKPGAQLVWVPSGWLGVLPAALAQDPVSKRRLGDAYEITVTPSLATLAAVRDRAASADAASLAAIINPTGDLPGSDMEGAFIAAQFPESGRAVLAGENATLGSVLDALKGRSYWHFASHGTFTWSDVRQSALIMHNAERLSVGRLLEVDGLSRPRLVVLSACETGLSEITRNPDEFVGLPGAFMALGAAGVLGTLWPVSDIASALLIARFYELHIGERLRPATALQRAQVWLREATNEELSAYVQGAAGAGRIARGFATATSEAMSPESLKKDRNSSAVEWLAAPASRGDSPAKDAQPAPAVARPFAHPYYWAGFVHTGH